MPRVHWRGTPIERFLEKVSPCPITGCWWWTSGGDGSDGYGRHVVSGRRKVAAHRFAWYVATGVMPPPDACVCHRCDQPACVNPDHLFLGSSPENTADRHSKGRSAKGRRIRSAKLTEDQVREIRTRHAPRPSGVKTGGRNSARALAREFGVTLGAVQHIVRRWTWAHVK